MQFETTIPQTPPKSKQRHPVIIACWHDARSNNCNAQKKEKKEKDKPT